MTVSIISYKMATSKLEAEMVKSVKYICPECGYESEVAGLCPNCQVPLVASCPECGNPIVGELIQALED